MNNLSSFESASLVEAIRSQRFDEAEAFLQQGADVNEIDLYFKTSALENLVQFDMGTTFFRKRSKS
jgi:hypothetical protein